MATIRDVAKEAGVSPATVSRAFTTPNLINLLTQERVLAAARTLNYRPPRLRESRQAFGGMLDKFRSVNVGMNAIGFQFFAASHSRDDALGANGFYAPVLFGAQAEAASLGLHLLIHTTHRGSIPAEIPRMVQEQAIGGLLLVGAADPAVVRSLAEHISNIVLVDNHDESSSHESVVSDGFSGAILATKYLIALHHRRIAFFLSEPGVKSFQDRLRGYRCAMLEADICPTPDLVFGTAAANHKEACAGLIEGLQASNRPTALVCANDESAHRVVRVCREIGLQVPEDVSVIGFDDVAYRVNAELNLTTIRVDKEYLGRLAVRRLHDRFKVALGALKDQIPIRHVAPVSLIVRDSCRALP